MTQPPVRRQPGLPVWVWILVLIIVIAVIWWIAAAERTTTGVPEEPFTEAPELAAPPADLDEGTQPAPDPEDGTELDSEPIEEPAPPPP